MLRCKNVSNLDLDENNPWTALLASISFSMRATHHTTIGASPAQVVFGRDMIHPLQYTAGWDLIKNRKQQVIDKSNVRENSKRVPYNYKVGQKVLIVNSDIQRKLDCPTQGPFEVLAVHPENGNVTLKRGCVEERINIRRLKPYLSPPEEDNF